jgi:hypothetical protein
VLIVVLSTGGAASSAGAKVLATTFGGRSTFYAFATVGVFKPHRLSFKVTSRNSGRPLRVSVRLRCGNDYVHYKVRYEKKLTSPAPAGGRVRLHGSRPPVCIFEVSAQHADKADGWMAVTLRGRGMQVIHAGQ